MNKMEFNAKVKAITGEEPIVSENAWTQIQYVYTWHPCIDPVKGKEQIAYLYSEFGMRIIQDMIITANNAEEYEKEMNKAKAAYDTAKERYERLKCGRL